MNFTQKILIYLFLCNLFLACTSKQDLIKPEEENPTDNDLIPIDENSAFSEVNFKASFDQLFFDMTTNLGILGELSSTHKYDDRGFFVASFLGSSALGDFYKELVEVKHIYSEKGVILSSTLTDQNDIIANTNGLTSLSYKYNSIGMISEIVMSTPALNAIRTFQFKLFYDSSKRLVEKVSESDGTVTTIKYTYNSEGKIKTMEYQNSQSGVISILDFSFNTTFNISGIKLTNINHSGNNQIDFTTYLYNYDTENRIISVVNDSGKSLTVTYLSDELIQIGQNFRAIPIGSIVKNRQNRIVSFTDYNYNVDEFLFAERYSYDDKGLLLRVEFLSGQVEEPNVTGYVIVDEINNSNGEITLLFYTEQDELIYTGKFMNNGNIELTCCQYLNDFRISENTVFYNKEGNIVNLKDIPEEWISNLMGV